MAFTLSLFRWRSLARDRWRPLFLKRSSLPHTYAPHDIGLDLDDVAPGLYARLY